MRLVRKLLERARSTSSYTDKGRLMRAALVLALPTDTGLVTDSHYSARADWERVGLSAALPWRYQLWEA